MRAVLLLPALALLSSAQNTTIDDNDPSITYVGAAQTTAVPCNTEPNDVPQPGCLLTSPRNCTQHARGLQGIGEGASLKFKGSAITVSALLNNASALYNVTLDSTSQSIVGSRDSGPLLCTTLFSQSGLDESTEHEISVFIQGTSPGVSADQGGGLILYLDNFIVTNGNDSSSSSSSSPAPSSVSGEPSSSSGAPSTSGASTTSPPAATNPSTAGPAAPTTSPGAGMRLHSSYSLISTVFAFSYLALS